MVKLQRPATAQAIQFAGFRMVMIGMSSLASLVIARWLGVVDFGLYAAGAALVPLIMAFGMGGLDQLALRGEIPVKALPSLLGYWAIALLVVGGVACLLVPGIEMTSRIVALVILTSAAAESARQWWLLRPQLEGQLHIRARRELIIRVSAAAGLIAAVLIWESPVAAAVGQASVSILLLVAATRSSSARSSSRRAERATFTEFLDALRLGRLFALSGAAYVVYLSLSGVFLAAISPPEEAGVFRIAFGFFQIAIAIPIAINNEAFRPRLYALAEDREGTLLLRKQFARLNAAASVVVCIATGAVIVFGVPILLGEEFRGAAIPGLILAAALPMHFFNSYHGNLLVARRRVRMVIALQVAGIGGVCILATVLVPPWGAVGAAGSILGVESLMAIGYGLATTLLRKRT